ncbi:hypothetical protein N9X53_08140, partial [Mariniblastus sp.]|nr:hypothetical protein [Mariniblastus sp.]
MKNRRHWKMLLLIGILLHSEPAFWPHFERLSNIQLQSSPTDLARDARADSFGNSSAEPGVFFWDASPPAWPSFKYLKGEIVGDLTKTRTMALDDKGVIHSLGYKSDMHIKTDVREDSVARSAQGYKGFIGNVVSSDGYTYFLPAYSSSMGKLKRSTGEI